MAKAKEITGLDCAADAREWAAIVLRTRFEEVLELRGCALNFDDIEGVHDMRVATRRLRSALRDFAPLMKKRPLRRVRKDLKQLADALGAVRDEDVAIDALEKLQAESDVEQIKEGIEILLTERRAARENKRMDLMEVLAISNLSALQKRFNPAIDEAVKSNKSSVEITFNQAGSEAVVQSLQEFWGLGTSLYHPFQIEELHELRIAAKRLRYALELFTGCWGEEIVPFASEVAEMQSFLGEVHDCDVWIESLGNRLSAENSNNQSEFQAAVWLLSEFARKRSKNYLAALKLWNGWQLSGFAKRMQTIITLSEPPALTGDSDKTLS